MDFYVNPLSACSQCDSRDDVFRVVSSLVDCFKHLQGAINARGVRLFYDTRLESECLIAGENLKKTLSSLDRRDRDITVLWYTFTKNSAKKVSESIAVDFNKPDQDPSELGEQSIISEFWLSFGGGKWNLEAVDLESSGKGYIKRNCVDIGSLKKTIPCYEINPKHDETPYYDHERREYVAQMTFSDEDSNRLLLSSVLFGKNRFAFDSVKGVYVCFKCHLQNLWHGYEVDERNIPCEVIEMLKRV